MKHVLGVTERVWTRMIQFDKDDIEEAHEHQFDHFTLLATGKLQINVEGRESVFEAPHMILIRAKKVHEYKALEDNTIAVCIHSLDPDIKAGEIIDKDMVP